MYIAWACFIMYNVGKNAHTMISFDKAAFIPFSVIRATSQKKNRIFLYIYAKPKAHTVVQICVYISAAQILQFAFFLKP